MGISNDRTSVLVSFTLANSVIIRYNGPEPRAQSPNCVLIIPSKAFSSSAFIGARSRRGVFSDFELYIDTRAKAVFPSSQMPRLFRCRRFEQNQICFGRNGV